MEDPYFLVAISHLLSDEYFFDHFINIEVVLGNLEGDRREVSVCHIISVTLKF